MAKQASSLKKIADDNDMNSLTSKALVPIHHKVEVWIRYTKVF